MSFREHRASLWLIGLALSLVPLVAAHAQVDADTRLGRLGASTRAAVIALVDSAHAARLPTEPLVDRALEGAKKGADAERIVAAVRALSEELRLARAALGRGAHPDEITAGAGALHAGLQLRDLARIRGAAAHGRMARATLPLTVATDLVARSVPAATASAIVLSLTRAGLDDEELVMFQRDVRLDIDRGAEPSAAARTRARGAILRAGRRQG